VSPLEEPYTLPRSVPASGLELPYPFKWPTVADLSQRSVRSGAATLIARAAQLLLQLGLVMVLARLLTPADFGVQAMVLPIALLVNGIANAGLQSAIIQRDDLEHARSNAIFWRALMANGLLCGLMILVAPVVAFVYREPRALGVDVVWALVIFLATFSAVPEALLKREMRFAVVVRAQLAAVVVSVVIAILVARMGAAHWTFIIQVGCVELVRVAIIWRITQWRPPSLRSLRENADGWGAVRQYWRGYAGARALGWVGEQADRMMIAVVGGAPVAGLYDVSKRWGWFTFVEPYLAVSEVAVASLSRARHDAVQFQRYLRGAFLPILAFALPAMAFIFAHAKDVLGLFLGSQWVGAADLLRAVCFTGMFASISRLAQWIYLATGRTDRQMQWTAYATPVLVIGAVVGARWGAIGVAVGFGLANAVLAVPSVLYAVRTTTLSATECLLVFARPFAASAGATVIAMALDSYLPLSAHPGGMVVHLLVFGGAYLVCWLVQPGGLAMVRDVLGRERVLDLAGRKDVVNGSR
jgi:O-antigen/teichoic acid export membrane protein